MLRFERRPIILDSSPNEGQDFVVPFFKPMNFAPDLPPVGTGNEDLVFDLKRQYAQVRDHAEMAKDIAALANTLGGTILVGADEDRQTGRVAAYHYLSDADANAYATELGVAGRDFVSPSPLIDAKPINVRPNENVTVCNVWPYPSQAVGASDVGRGDRFRFPYRVGTQTRYLRAEQLPMLMEPSIRRAAILLEAIPGSERDRVFIYHMNAKYGQGSRNRSRLIEVDVLRNVVVLDMIENGTGRATIPLDAVKSVWRTQHEDWWVVVTGTLSLVATPSGPNDRGGWQFCWQEGPER